MFYSFKIKLVTCYHFIIKTTIQSLFLLFMHKGFCGPIGEGGEPKTSCPSPTPSHLSFSR
uniref:Uncharacterized protein n=1 Tax=Nelumbo nucifera TaxID=4432 RepID=A0A822XQB7_NELNU|nr:TPA_asm: hypothetical protein HUJ06_023989 [Nelumbo nucifera]